jgi:SAM-dependent methyltransferase
MSNPWYRRIGLAIWRFIHWLITGSERLYHWYHLQTYRRSDRRPWRFGFREYERQYWSNAIKEPARLAVFRRSAPLPKGYAYRLGPRAVEIPWVIARLPEQPARILDAGSALNFEPVLKHPVIANKKITIATLAPEENCFWELGVEYVFEDFRHLYFRDDVFDVITSISTLEHIGMDNTRYAGKIESARRHDPADLFVAVKELKRVLKPGGVMYVTVPFGRYEDHGWLQQFDARLLDQLIETFAPVRSAETIYHYDPAGWALSDRTACAECEYFDARITKYFDPKSTIEYPPDYPAAERALACLELYK